MNNDDDDSDDDIHDDDDINDDDAIDDDDSDDDIDDDDDELYKKLKYFVYNRSYLFRINFNNNKFSHIFNNNFRINNNKIFA